MNNCIKEENGFGALYRKQMHVYFWKPQIVFGETQLTNEWVCALTECDLSADWVGGNSVDVLHRIKYSGGSLQ